MSRGNKLEQQKTVKSFPGETVLELSVMSHSLLQLLTSRRAGWRAVRTGERSCHEDGRK